MLPKSTWGQFHKAQIPPTFAIKDAIHFHQQNWTQLYKNYNYLIIYAVSQKEERELTVSKAVYKMMVKLIPGFPQLPLSRLE